MSYEASQSKPANDMEKYSSAEISSVGARVGVNTAGYLDKTSIVNELRESEIQRHAQERFKHEPTYVAMMHGHEPSRGAKIDAELRNEEAKLIEGKKEKSENLRQRRLERSNRKSG